MLGINIVPLMCLVAVFLSTVSGQRNHDCTVAGRYYRHNQLFSLPNQSHCIKYICWYGRVIRRIEACEVEGDCHRVGSTFEHRCTRYRCNKVDRGHLVYFQPEIVSTRCRDFNGRCRRPGENFPFQMHGRYYESCTCTTAHASIRYSCTSYQYPRVVSGSRGSSNNQGSPIIRGISGGGHGQRAYIVRGANRGEEDSEVSISIASQGVQNGY